MAPSTTNRILDAAQTLFAEHGFDATSLRAITTEADANIAAVNYHFGGKDGLIQAVFHRLLTPLNERRLALLDAAEAESKPNPAPTRAVLEAFLRPPLELYQRPEGVILGRLMGRLLLEGGPHMGQLMQTELAPILERFPPALGAAEPQLNAAELRHRFHFVVGAMMQVLHTACAPLGQACAQNSNPAPDSEALLESLLNFCSAGLSAPSSSHSEVAR